MENKADNDWEQFEEQEEDALSLCNLAMLMHESNSKSSSPLQTPRSNSFSSPPELFRFSNELASPEFYYSAPDIVFCGKLIEEEEELNEYQKRDYLTMVRSQSLRKSPSHDGYPFSLMPDNSEAEEINKSSVTRKSGSLRISSSNSRSHSSSHHHHHRRQDQKVNITSLTSMSAKSRRRMFMFGPVKFKPEMELSAIKERQGKRLTTLMSPPTVLDDGKAVVYDGGKRGKRNHFHWGLVKLSLMGRAHLSNVFTKSFGFGCIPFHAAAGNIIKVAN